MTTARRPEDRASGRTTRLRSPRNLIGAFHLLVLAVAASLVALERFAGRRGLLAAWTREGGPVETGSFAVLLLIAVYGGFRGIRPRERPLPGRAGLLLPWILASAALLAALEEISWGQHIFGFESPPFFQTHNRQAETNLHNLAPAELFGLATNTAVYALFVFGPILLRLARPAAGSLSTLRAMAPSVHNILMFCAAFAFQAYFRMETAADTAAFPLALGGAAWLIARESGAERAGHWAHWTLVVGCAVLFMVSFRVFRYHNLQYEIREFIIAYGILYWMLGWPRRPDARPNDPNPTRNEASSTEGPTEGSMDGNTLNRFEFFEGLDPANRETIAGMAEVREYAPDAIIFQGGDPADAIFGLLEGTVELSLLFRDRVLKTDEVKYEEAIRARFEETDTPIVLDEIQAGEVFGWSALAGLERRTAAARAASAVRAFAVPAEKLRKQFGENPALGLRLMERLNRVIAARLAERTERLVEAWTEAFGAGRI